MKDRNLARSQLAGAPLLVAQLGAMEFRDRLIKGDEKILKSLHLGTQMTVAEILKKFGRAPPLAILELCYGRKEFDFVESLLQVADDLDFVQNVLSAVGASHKINPIYNGVLAGFNRRRRLQRFKRGHYNLELDLLRYAETASPLDSDLVAKDVKDVKGKTVQSDNQKKQSTQEPCWFFQKSAGCRRKKCPYTHKCVICDVPGHGAIECSIRRKSETSTETADRPPNPRTRRARAQ